jgi:hypothetical protein
MIAKGIYFGDLSLLQKAKQLIENSQVMVSIRQRLLEIISKDLFTDGLNVLRELRVILIDLVISLYEVALLDSKNSNSNSSGNSNDELGHLVELMTSEFDLVSCQLKLGHIVRVWLQKPS